MSQDLRLYKPFIGRQVADCVDTIKIVALTHHLKVRVLEPASLATADVDPNRLNVWTDDGSHVKKFTVG